MNFDRSNNRDEGFIVQEVGWQRWAQEIIRKIEDGGTLTVTNWIGGDELVLKLKEKHNAELQFIYNGLSAILVLVILLFIIQSCNYHDRLEVVDKYNLVPTPTQQVIEGSDISSIAQALGKTEEEVREIVASIGGNDEEALEILKQMYNQGLELSGQIGPLSKNSTNVSIPTH